MENVVLVTGANGFVGRHLVKKLINENLKVIAVSRNENNDISDWRFTKELFKKYRIEICFHLAGNSSVEDGYKMPRESLQNNINSAINILEAVRIFKTNKLIIASTSQVYGDSENLPFKESHTPTPSRIYETSKACADIISQSYVNSYSIPVFIARFTNIYGPGDLNFSRIIPKTLNFIYRNESPKIWGGESIRNYLYIDDAISAYIRLMKADLGIIKNNIFNFSTNEAVSVNDLVKKILYYSKEDLAIEYNKNVRKDEISIQLISSKKAETVLNWKAEVSLDQGLKKTIKWYKKYLKK